MLQHFEEMISGIRYLVCTYSNGPSGDEKGRYRLVVYQMFGSDIEEEEIDGDIGRGESHIRLELMAIRAALQKIGRTTHPVVFLSRQKYLFDYANKLRANSFRKTDGKAAANLDLWREIEALDPNDRIEWRFATEDYDKKVEEWKADKQLDSDIQQAEGSNPC